MLLSMMVMIHCIILSLLLWRLRWWILFEVSVFYIGVPASLDNDDGDDNNNNSNNTRVVFIAVDSARVILVFINIMNGEEIKQLFINCN